MTRRQDQSILAQWLALEGGWEEGHFWCKWVDEVIVHLLTDWASPGDEQAWEGDKSRPCPEHTPFPTYGTE